MSAMLAAAVLIGTSAGAASAKSQPQPGDPPPTSPSAAVYQIPLDNGRADAAPRKRSGSSAGQGASSGSGGTGGGGPNGSQGTSGSGYSGSSQNAAGGPGSSGSSNATQTSTSQSTIHSDNGFGSSTKVPGTRVGGDSSTGRSANAGLVPVPTSTGTSGGPTAGTWLLLALIGAFGAYFGVTASRALRRR
jgi:hypothetical protein